MLSSRENCGELASRLLSEQLCMARSEGGAFLVSPQSVVRLSGTDAFRYLNGQVTRDLSRLSEGTALPACLLTPKGKLSAPILIHRACDNPDDLLVEADPLLAESLMIRLDRYIVADDVILSLEPSQETIHFFGAAASDLPHSAILVNRLGSPGHDLPYSKLGESLPSLLDPRVIETLRIERGIPAWGCEMSEETLPPEVGFDLTHIDYDRGCYPGQETISRLKSIGRVNRLLARLDSQPGTKLSAGMSLATAEGKEIATITSAAEQWDTGAFVSLALLPRNSLENGETLLTEEKTPLSIVPISAS